MLLFHLCAFPLLEWVWCPFSVCLLSGWGLCDPKKWTPHREDIIKRTWLLSEKFSCALVPFSWKPTCLCMKPVDFQLLLRFMDSLPSSPVTSQMCRYSYTMSRNMWRRGENSKAVLTVHLCFISSVTCPHSGLIAVKFQKHVLTLESFPDDRPVRRESPHARGLVHPSGFPWRGGMWTCRGCSVFLGSRGLWAVFMYCLLSSYFVLLARMLWNKCNKRKVLCRFLKCIFTDGKKKKKKSAFSKWCSSLSS